MTKLVYLDNGWPTGGRPTAVAGDLRLYHYPADEAWPEHWGVASGWGWLPGLTDTAETAVALDQLDTETLYRMRNTINWPPPEGQARPITMTDIRAARSRVYAAGRRRMDTAMRRIRRRAERRSQAEAS